MKLFRENYYWHAFIGYLELSIPMTEKLVEFLELI